MQGTGSETYCTFGCCNPFARLCPLQAAGMAKVENRKIAALVQDFLMVQLWGSITALIANQRAVRLIQLV